MMKRTMIGLAVLALAMVIGLTGPVSAQTSEAFPLWMQNAYVAQSSIDITSISLVTDVSGTILSYPVSLFGPVYAPVSYPLASPVSLGYTISATPVGPMPIIGDISASASSHSMTPGSDLSYNEFVSASGTITNFYFSTSYTA